MIKKAIKWGMKIGLTALCAMVMVTSAAYLYLAPQLPSAETYKNVQLETPLRIYTADLKLIDEIGNRRNPVSFEEIPKVLTNALIASEDARFYSHPGVDVKGLLRGLWGFVRGTNLGGGSTITMQLAKQLTFEGDNVYLRKFKEIPFALQIQRELSKEEILTLYLNLVFFGPGADGIGAASFIYYGKQPSELTLAEAAMMPAVLPCPSRCNPVRNPEIAIQRRNVVLNKMFNENMISQTELEQALAVPVTARRHNRSIEVSAPYVAEMVRQQLYAEYGEATYSQGFEVVTTIDSEKQLAANKALIDGLEIYYDKSHGFRGVDAHFPEDILEPTKFWLEELQRVPVYGNQHPAIVTQVDDQAIRVLLKNGDEAFIDWQGLRWARPYINDNVVGARPQSASDIVQTGDLIRVKMESEGWALGQLPDVDGALISMIPDTGRIIALVGGYDFRRSQVNRVLTPRPPGSNFKPFVYGTALESNYSAASTINDAPLIRGSYRPQNYENNFLGPVTLRYALKESRNVPTVRLFDQLGSDKVLAFAAKFGFQTQNFPQYDLTVALGSQDVKPIEMVTAYSAIANGGYKVEPWFIKQITDLSNQRVYKSEPVVVCQRVAACTGQAPVDRPSIGPSLTPNESGINEIAQANPDTYHSAPQIIDPRIAYILNSMLRSVVEEGSGQGVQRALRRGDLMGKTGTTNGPQELWFSGFNADIATTVFVGFDQPASLGEREQGASVAVPIWIDYMRVALENSPENVMQRPDGLVDRLIDKTTGALATPGDANTIFEYFRIENAPQPLPDTQTPSNSTENQGEEELSTEILF